MKPILSSSLRPRVITSRLEWLNRRRDLAHLARRAVTAPSETIRGLAASLVLIRAVGGK